MGDKFRGPLFVIGAGRSGTKLLRKLLINHPQIYLTDEAEILPYMIRKWGSANLKDKAEFNRVYRDICSTSKMIDYKIKGNLISFDEWYGLCKKYDFEGIIEALTRWYVNVDKNDDILWGDKTPTYNRHVKILKRSLPNSKFIHIIRDVRDVCLSARKAWKSNIFQYAQSWYDDIKKCQEDFKTLDSSDYIEIRYEDLITEPARIMDKCFHFVGLEFSEDYLRLDKSVEPVGHAKNRNVIMKGNFGHYKEILSAKKIRRIEELTWPMLDFYGYNYNYTGPVKKISKVRLWWYMLPYGCNRLTILFRRYGFKNLSLLIKRILAKFKI
ncbi:MAG: sulfotransferase family protein [Planctomycetota bacterium]|jgi:hypothetical protein